MKLSYQGVPMRKALLFLFACLALGLATPAQTVAPIQGLGNIQFFSQTGVPLTSGVLYSYQAGTTTQQATYTDSTGLSANPNPIPFTSGARASIWLTIGQFYKFVLCVQNDGPTCAPSDVLFSTDQVPGGASTSGSSGTFTGVFISGSPTPATSGILRLANNDTICWRNAANTTNLCFSMNGNNLLNWAGGSLSMPQINSPAAGCLAGLDILWADNTANRWMFCGNGAAAQQFVGSGVDINTSDQVTQLHFGASAYPLCAGGLTTGQSILWNGTNLCGAAAQTQTFVNATSGGTTANLIVKLTGAPSTVINATTTDSTGAVGICFSGCGTSGSAQVSVAGQNSCVFDGATTAGDYVQISGTVNGDCHDSGATPAAGQVIGRVLSTNVGAGTYTIDLFPAEIRSQVPLTQFTNKNLGGNVSVSANTLTTIDSVSVTFPASGGPWRVQINYAYFNAGGVNVECDVTDGTNFWGLWEQGTTSNISMCSGSQWSPVTYANGTSKTFTVQVYNTGASTVTTVGNINGSVPSSMQVSVVQSN